MDNLNDDDKDNKSHNKEEIKEPSIEEKLKIFNKSNQR